VARPPAFRLAPDETKRLHYVVHLDELAAHGTKRRPRVNELQVRVKGTARWEKGPAGHAHSTLEIVATSVGPQPGQLDPAVHSWEPTPLLEMTRVWLGDELPCPESGPCDIPLHIDVHWARAEAGELAVELQLSVTAFSDMLARRSKDPPRGAAISVSAAPAEDQDRRC
jgi:hypothetical protein